MSLSRALPATVLLAVLAACGGPDPAPEASVPWDGPVVWVESKPNPAVGAIRAAVVARPSPDRAVIEAVWEARAGLETCELEIVLPEGAYLLEGEASEPLSAGASDGTARWQVEFPAGRDLDAVLRFCAHTSLGRRSCEVTVRLVSAGDATGD